MKTLEELRLSQASSEAMAGMIKNNRIPHSIAITDGNSRHRLECAYYLAAAIVCTGGHRPCMTCRSCKKADGKNHPDVILVDPETWEKHKYNMKQLRLLINDFEIAPNEAEKKVYIFKDAGTMNPNCQNALLKTLEEPKSHLAFILECSSRLDLLGTIVSRVCILSCEDIPDRVSDKKQEAADALAASLCDALTHSYEADFLKLTTAFHQKKDYEFFKAAVFSMQRIIRDALAVKIGVSCFTGPSEEVSRLLAGTFTEDVLLSLSDRLNEFIGFADANANKTLLYTRFCSVLRQTAYS